jgi:hypothetical protein
LYSPAPSHLIQLQVVLAAILLCLLSSAAESSARVSSFRPIHQTSEHAVFAPRGIAPASVRRGHVRVGHQRRRLAVSRLRRALQRGRLRTRLYPPGRGRARHGHHGHGPRGQARRPRGARTRRSRRPRVRLVVVSRVRRRGLKHSKPGPPSNFAPCGEGSLFSVGSWPPACWRPYSAASPFNQRLSANPRVVSGSAAMVSRLLNFGKLQSLEAGTADTSADFGTPIYYSGPGDPLFKVQCTQWVSSCEVDGLQIRIPAQARAAGGGDGHLVVVDQQSGWEYDFWQVQRSPVGNGGTLRVSHGGALRLDGLGLDSNATAAGFGRIAGVIRAQELAGGEINHALLMVVYCDSGSHVYPAHNNSGRDCSDIGLSNSGAPPLGTRFQLNYSDAEIDALAAPPWKKTILRAMAHYGLYFTDTGSGSWAIQAESGSTYTSFGYEDELVKFARIQPGVTSHNGTYNFDLHDGVDWSRLRAIDPCVTNSSC